MEWILGWGCYTLSLMRVLTESFLSRQASKSYFAFGWFLMVDWDNHGRWGDRFGF